MMRRRAAAYLVLLSLSLSTLPTGAAGGLPSINPGDLREWLTFIASDELQGRATYSAGLGLAAAYIQTHLRDWGVRPVDPGGSYLQTVRVQEVRRTSRSSATIRVGEEVRTFSDGAGITFPRNSGQPRTFTVDRVEFAGYGLETLAVEPTDRRAANVAGAVVVWLGADGPSGVVDPERDRRLLNGRGRRATEERHAAASIGPSRRPSPEASTSQTGDAPVQDASVPQSAPAAASGADSNGAPDFTTSRRLDQPRSPVLTADDPLLEFLFSRAPVRYDELKRRADAREALPSFRLEDVAITFNIDVDYQVVRTRLTHNIVGIVEGSDPGLRNSYVAFGAHYDHVGYAERELTSDGGPRAGTPGRVTPGAEADRIWNGADDDGSGTVALMALARAFVEGPRPKRSLLFVWHAGEERGLLGSRYFVDHPPVSIEAIVAQLNVDMIGRSRGDEPSEADTVYLVGSDRISSELHEVSREANRALTTPLTLNYEMNDPSDVEQVYYRSDHYSYASAGIPVIFFTTGLHADYHANTDEVSKIQFDKLTRVAQLVYETGLRVGNLDHPPVRDNRGPRAGRDAR